MRYCLLLFLQIICLASTAQTLIAHNLRCEYRANPLGIETETPALSWELQSSGRNIMQTAYRVLVADDPVLIMQNKGNIWDSKKIYSDQSLQISFNGKPLKSAKKYYWKVIVWDNKGHISESKIVYWQMGLLQPSDWKNAQWIAYEVLPNDKVIFPFIHMGGPQEWGKRENILPLFRKEFLAEKPIKSVTAYVSGLGHCEMFVNGTKTSDHFLDPGWTQYNKKGLYAIYDITEQIRQGENAVGFMLGNGFYYIPGERYRKLTGGFGYPKLKARIVINYTDGSTESIVTNKSWKTAASPIFFSSIYGGEDYDANKEQTGWLNTGFNDTEWQQPYETTGPVLNAQIAYPLKHFNRFKPLKTKQLDNDSWFIDLGQNFSGIPFIAVSGKKGDTVRITPGELINEDYSINQRASGGPHYYQYVLKGEGIEKWQPQFTYYGFRYLVVDGATMEKNSPSIPRIHNVGGLHTRYAAPDAGSFTTSFGLFKQINELIKWAMKSNMASVLTDCPHREKLGWLEQYHLMGNSLRYNYDIAALCKKMVTDMQMAQTEEGLIPDVAPEYVHFIGAFRDSPEWGSAGVILPWYMYQWYGDKTVLSDAYHMMQRYVTYLQSKTDSHILYHGLGDWLDLGPGPYGPSQLTPPGITPTAIFYYDLQIMSKVAKLLNKETDASNYEKMALEVKNQFNKKFFNSQTKQYGSGSQTANAMALYMNLVEPQYKHAVLENLISDIKLKNLSAGDVGYRYVLRTLENEGRSDVIYGMNRNSDVPGYGYQIKKGATSLIEDWKGTPGVSQNHFMLGHLMEWFYSGLAGIRQAPDAVAYKKIEIRPQVVDGIDNASASYNAPYGIITSGWKIDKGVFHLNVQIPVNTTAIIFFPDNLKKAPVAIGSGKYSYKIPIRK